MARFLYLYVYQCISVFERVCPGLMESEVRRDEETGALGPYGRAHHLNDCLNIEAIECLENRNNSKVKVLSKGF
jgi:hypothetical protein